MSHREEEAPRRLLANFGDRRSPMDQPPHVKYIVEAYVPTSQSASLGDRDVRLRAAAEEMAAEGTGIRYLNTLLIPEEEICFFVFEASSPEYVAEVSRRAEIGYERIVRAL
jgi:hypothetical protein